METNHREQCGTATGDDFLEFEVDYGKDDAEYAASFRALVKEGAYIGYCEPDATPEHYPSGGLRGIHHWRVYLFQPVKIPKWYWTNKEVTDGIATNPYGKKQIHPFDLLALCAKHKQLGLDFPLMASFENTWCGSDGRRRVLSVGSRDDKRALRLRYLGDGYWYDDGRFPVLCEVPATRAGQVIQP